MQGLETKGPAFGLDALWIEKPQKAQAESLDYRVLDASTVIATHLNSILQSHCHERFGHSEIGQLLSLLTKRSPQLAEQLPKIVNTNVLLKVLQSLLSEHVPIRDMQAIAETLAAAGEKSQYSVTLTAATRIALNRVIVQSSYAERSELPVIALNSKLEQLLLRSILQLVQSGIEQESEMTIEPNLAKSLQQLLVDAAPKQELFADCAVLFIAALLIPMLSRFARYPIDGLHVLACQETPTTNKLLSPLAQDQGFNARTELDRPSEKIV